MSTRAHSIDYIGKICVYGISVMSLLSLMFSSDMLKNISLLAFSFRILFIIDSLAFLALFLIKKQSTLNKKQSTLNNIFILLFIILTSFFSYFLNQTGALFDFCILLIYYISLPVYLILIPELKYDESDAVWFKIVSQVYFMFFVYCGIFHPTYRIGTGALMLGFTNSNVTGVYLMLEIIMLLISYRNYVERWTAISFFLFFEVCVLFYLLILTQSRTSFFIALFCLLYSIFPETIRVGKVFSIVCLFTPAIFLYFYTYIYSRGWFLNATILGSTVYSGRQVLFQEELLGYSLLGMSEECCFKGLNISLAIINMFGIIGFFLYSLLFVSFLKSDFLDICDSNFKKQIMRFSFSFLLLHGCTEICLFTGGTAYAGMLACILMAGACVKCNN